MKQEEIEKQTEMQRMRDIAIKVAEEQAMQDGQSDTESQESEH